jgi:AraC-like DNA-binding protein
LDRERLHFQDRSLHFSNLLRGTMSIKKRDTRILQSEICNPQSFELWRPAGLQGIEFLKAAYTEHEFPRHWHDKYVVEIVERGVNEFFCEGRTFTAPAGSIVIIHPGEVHTGRSVGKERLEYRCIYPSRDLIKSFLGPDPGIYEFAPRFKSNVIDDPELASHLIRLHHRIEKGAGTLESQTLLAETLSSLVNRHSESMVISGASLRMEPYRIRRACEFMNDNHSDRITLDQLASAAGLSLFHFLRLFRKSEGLPPYEFLTNVRVERARILLAKGCSISDAAQQTGFFDQSHLNRHFKRLLGITPGQYRATSSKTRFL